MNVRDLRDILDGFDDTDIVCFVADEAGNECLRATDVTDGYLQNGDIVTAEEANSNAVRACVLWP